VKDGVSERGGFPVIQKLMRQWMMRITAYAQRLIDGLDTVDWTESLKEQQRNWIGRSVGALVKFAVDGKDANIEVFTTRVDTIYGVTFMVIAPEHELVDVITTAEQRGEIDAYIAMTQKKVGA
jgi:leucyl-tRNA synthetase